MNRERSKDQLSPFGQQYMGHMDSLMSKTGGSFAQSLRETFYKGGSDQREALVKAFPDYFNELDLSFDYYEPIPEEYLRYRDEGGKERFMKQVEKYLDKKFGYLKHLYIRPGFMELFYTYVGEMDNPEDFHFGVAFDHIVKTYDWGIKQGDKIQVWRNQAWRDATVSEIIGDEALIYYEMRKSKRVFYNVVKLWNALHHEDRLYKPYPVEKLPKKWQ